MLRTIIAALAIASTGLMPAGGCTSLGLETPATFNQRAAYAYANVTGAREGALKALQAGSITADDAAHVQALANRAREGIDTARGLANLGRPADAADRLRLAEAILAELTAYLNRRGKP